MVLSQYCGCKLLGTWAVSRLRSSHPLPVGRNSIERDGAHVSDCPRAYTLSSYCLGAKGTCARVQVPAEKDIMHNMQPEKNQHLQGRKTNRWLLNLQPVLCWLVSWPGTERPGPGEPIAVTGQGLFSRGKDWLIFQHIRRLNLIPGTKDRWSEHCHVPC